MSTIKKIAWNTALMTSASIISLSLGFIINIYLARDLQAGNYGVINAVLNLSTLFSFVADFGISTYLTMELARRPEKIKPYLGNALSMRLIFIAIAYTGIIATAYLGGYNQEKYIVAFILGAYLMVTAISQVFQATFQAVQKMEHSAVCQVLNPLVLIVGMYYVLTGNMGIIALSLVYLASGLVLLAYNLIMAVRLFSFTPPRFDFDLWKVLLVGGFPFIISSVFYFLSFRIDIQLIDFMLGDVQVGYYSAAYKLIEALTFLPIIYTTVIFPVISAYFHQNNSNLKVLLQKSLKYAYILGFPIVVGLFLLSDKFIFFLYEDGYNPAIPVLQALAVGLLISFANTIWGSFLMGTNMQIASNKISIGSMIVNIALNLAVLPVFGIVGSAWTMVITNLVIFSVMYYLVKKAGYSFMSVADAAKITICSLLMGLFVYFAHDNNLFVIIAAAAVIYFALIFLTRTFSKDDIELFMKIFHRKKEITI
ncbi:flippase [Methanocella sp. MCL-LM]|uniref:flippase n=1 Tax=Methanocella sp. MCL-LM TaxID=3412035 RepID=UPI003C765056